MNLKYILSECWTGYKQVGMKNKGGRQVPNCVPESVTESSKEDIIKDLDRAKNDLLKKVDALIAKKKKLYSDVDIESPMTSDEKKLDKDIADLFSDINKLVLQKRSLKEAQAVSGGKVHKLITGKNLKFKGKSYNQIDFETLGVDNKNGTIRLRIIAPKEIFGNEMSLDFRTVRRGPFFKTDSSNQLSEEKTYKKGEGDSVNEETYKVAGRPVVLIKGKNSNGTDWKVKFQNGKETSLSDVIALIKPFPKDIKESELKGYLAADVVDDIVKTIGSKMVKGHVENAPNKNYIYLKLTDIKFGNDVVKMLKSKFGIDSKIDKTFGNIPTISFPSKKVVSEGKSINEFMMPRDVDSKMKELGINKIPISSQGEKVLQGMVKEKFLDKVTNTERLIYFVESLGNEKFGYRSKGKPLSSLVDRFWNDITSEAIFFGGKMAAYQVAMNIKDMKRNGEQLDSPYQMMKEYFKNFGMDHDRSRVFDSAIRNLEEWMKRNKIQESVNEGRGIKSIQKDLDKTITAIESEIASYKETKGTPQEKKHIDNLKKLHPIKKKLEAELDGVVSGLYRDAELKIEEGAITEKQFKGLEGIPSTTSLEKISKDQKLKIIKAPGNIIDFIVPKGVNRNFWQVIGTGKIQKNLGGNYVLLGKVIHSPAFKSMDDLIDGVNWKSMEDRRRFNESVNEAKEIKWQDVEVGDVANVKAINKTGLIIKTYGRKFHLKFPNGSTKTYDADELTFIKN